MGAERGRHAGKGADPLLGMRTFLLVAEAGAVSAHLSIQFSSIAVFVGAMVCVVLLVLGGFMMTARDQASPGLTTEIAALVVFLLGGAVVLGRPEVPVALAVVTGLVLALKDPLHEGIRRLGQDDVLAGLKLLFATFIVLPLLPREPIDPWGALNLYALWWLVILIASISLVGYVGVRLLGQNRGLAVTGFFGGLVSSTAVSLSLARRSREAPGLSRPLTAGLLIAWLTMSVRVLVEVAAVEPAMLPALVGPMAAFTLPGVVAAALAWRGATDSDATDHDSQVVLRNPFSLTGAIKIGALFAVVVVGVRLARLYLPASGVYLVSALAGFTDVDAITLSLAQEVGAGALGRGVAVRGVLIAAAANTVTKLGLVAVLGSREMARAMALATLAMFACGALAVLLSGA